MRYGVPGERRFGHGNIGDAESLGSCELNERRSGRGGRVFAVFVGFVRRYRLDFERIGRALRERRERVAGRRCVDLRKVRVGRLLISDDVGVGGGDGVPRCGNRVFGLSERRRGGRAEFRIGRKDERRGGGVHIIVGAGFSNERNGVFVRRG